MNSNSNKESQPDVEIVNIVGSGKLELELDLASVAEDLSDTIWIDDVEHSRNSGNRLLIDFNDGETLGILAPSGVYVFTGANTYKKVDESHEQLFEALTELGIISGVELKDSEIDDEFKIQNVVCTAELDDDLDVNLNTLAIGLGMEKTEYEPEQFPGLVFRPDSSNCTILIFSSGKVVITGVNNEQVAQEEFTNLKELINTVLG